MKDEYVIRLNNDADIDLFNNNIYDCIIKNKNKRVYVLMSNNKINKIYNDIMFYIIDGYIKYEIFTITEYLNRIRMLKLNKIIKN